LPELEFHPRTVAISVLERGDDRRSPTLAMALAGERVHVFLLVGGRTRLLGLGIKVAPSNYHCLKLRNCYFQRPLRVLRRQAGDATKLPRLSPLFPGVWPATISYPSRQTQDLCYSVPFHHRGDVVPVGVARLIRQTRRWFLPARQGLRPPDP
jgi:hypothetical protein